MMLWLASERAVDALQDYDDDHGLFTPDDSGRVYPIGPLTNTWT